MRKYAAKVDANQGEIVRELRQVFGPDCVVDTSRVGGGFPDLLLGIRGVNLLIEVKTPAGKLTQDQVIFHKTWSTQGQIAIARNLQEVIEIVNRMTV